MSLDRDSADTQIPHYLSAASKDALKSELKEFQKSKSYKNFFASIHIDNLLQGDCAEGFIIYNNQTGEKKRIFGMNISNSCDVSPDNNRIEPAFIQFSPLIPFSKYQQGLYARCTDKNRCDEYLRSIKNQEISRILYIPPIQERGDFIVRLDNIVSMPLPSEDQNFKIITSLSNFGFYFLLFKLTIHFCRFLENIDRSAHGQN